MVNFSNSENVDMVMFYGVADGNAANCESSAFQIARIFTSAVQHLRNHGTVKPPTQDRGRARIEIILQAEE